MDDDNFKYGSASFGESQSLLFIVSKGIFSLFTRTRLDGPHFENYYRPQRVDIRTLITGTERLLATDNFPATFRPD